MCHNNLYHLKEEYNGQKKALSNFKIADIINKFEGICYATSLDLNMVYYTIQLDPDSKKLCTIITLWGEYQYLWLPMGVNMSPNIFQ